MSATCAALTFNLPTHSDVLRITEIDPSKLASLDDQLRKIYYNVRMRMQARPEMLERGDGLATTFAQVEKLIIDGWTLLRPLLFDDVEASRGLRRYVALQTSTPHKRRAKPKPGALPKPEPVVPKVDPVERQVSGFLLLEHELATGAIHVAVTMPWVSLTVGSRVALPALTSDFLPVSLRPFRATPLTRRPSCWMRHSSGSAAISHTTTRTAPKLAAVATRRCRTRPTCGASRRLRATRE